MNTLKESEEYQDIVRRVNRCVGHIEGIRNMIDQDRTPKDILVQLTAVRASITSLTRLIMCTYIEDGIKKVAETQDKEELEKVLEAFNQLYK